MTRVNRKLRLKTTTKKKGRMTNELKKRRATTMMGMTKTKIKERQKAVEMKERTKI